MGKFKESIKAFGYALNGVEPTGKYTTDLLKSVGATLTSQTINVNSISDILYDIADKKSTLALTITPYTGNDDLFGKKASDLQTDVAIADGVVSGELYYVEGYDPKLHHFLVLKAVASDQNAKITAQIIGGESPAMELDADGICVFKIKNKTTQSLQYVVEASGIKRTYNLALTGLTLDSKN